MSDNVVHAVSGALGGVTSIAITYPLIFLSTRAQVDADHKHVRTIEAIKLVLEKEGITGLYAGLSSALFGIGLTNGEPQVVLNVKVSTISGTNGARMPLKRRMLLPVD